MASTLGLVSSIYPWSPLAAQLSRDQSAKREGRMSGRTSQSLHSLHSLHSHLWPSLVLETPSTTTHASGP